MEKKFNFKIIISFLFLSSCTVIQRTAVNTTADIAQTGQKEIQKMNSWEEIKSALPASLAFAETLYPSSPNNLTLLTQLIKGYSALGFVIFETEAISNSHDKTLEKYFKEQASISYSKSINYGQKYLQNLDINWNSLFKGIAQEDFLFELLEKKTNQNDLDALFFLGQSWASLINLNRDNVKLVNHLPLARSLIKFVCKKNPDFEEGYCDLFEAIYQSSRPKTLGGNPEEGEKIFHQLIKKYPFNLLLPVSYTQFLLLPQKRISEIKKIENDLNEKFQNYKTAQLFPNYLNEKNDFLKFEKYNIYNVVAEKRFKIFSNMKE